MKLTIDNPGLKIVPMVDGELGGSNYSYSMGMWGNAEVDEVYHDEERIYFRSYDEDILVDKQADFIFDSEFPNQYINGKIGEEVTNRAKLYVRELDWEKVIVVKIKKPY